MQRLSESQRSYLREATTRYWRAFPDSPAAEYLANRGLDQQELSSEFLLGYVADPLPGHEMHRGSLAIPFLRWSQDMGKSVVSIRFRCIKDHEHIGHGKYMTQAGDRPRLYNTLALMRQDPTIAITEGELDAVTAQLAGVPAVGVPGAEAWQPHFREPFLGYETVYILADGDEPGMRFANTVARTLPNARVIPCPEGEDVNSLVQKNGPEALKERMK